MTHKSHTSPSENGYIWKNSQEINIVKLLSRTLACVYRFLCRFSSLAHRVSTVPLVDVILADFVIDDRTFAFGRALRDYHYTILVDGLIRQKRQEARRIIWLGHASSRASVECCIARTTLSDVRDLR